ncbi:MAG: preprotein translocase subunit SecE [Armatimonadota bacterium]
MASNAEQLPKPPSNWEGLGPYLKGVREELRKAIWPTRSELIQSTQVVVASIVGMAIFCGGFDFVLKKLSDFAFAK